MDRLKGKVALVTGGGRGIGRSLALALAREGAAVAISSRTMSELERVAEEIKAAAALAPSPSEPMRRAGRISVRQSGV